MKTFISVSGKLSTAIGLVLTDWLKSVLQHLEPWIAAEDISKGSQWSTVLSQTLSQTDCGIIVLCPDNLQRPWLMYEAGVIAARTRMQRVATLLIDVHPNDVVSPLDQFQHTVFNRDDVLKLIQDINSWTGGVLPTAKVDDVFSTWWSILEAKVSECKESCPASDATPRRTDSDLISEILELTRDVHRRTCMPHPEDRIRLLQREIRAASPSILDGLVDNPSTAVESVSFHLRPTGPTGPTGLSGAGSTRHFSATTFQLQPPPAGVMPNRDSSSS